MQNRLYSLALSCKSLSNEKIGIDRTRFNSGRLLYTDYTVKGAVNEYLTAVNDLCLALKEKYPDISDELKSHVDKYREDPIVHFTALQALVNCVLLLEKPRAKKIFISHSSKDVDIIKEFSDRILQLGIGLNAEDIFCTSIEDMGIRNGEDIRKHIRGNIQSADFSFLMISKNYKESGICMNEMGAVWATDNLVRYYLLPDADFKEIGWLCDTKKADRIESPVALDALEEELTDFYELPRKGASWSRQRQEFVEYLSNIYALEKI
ncbi:MAG: toll/interleukin-1 receptor domain-containing protein [Bacteroidales bacterium]|nr:toll/interleukin-1 receptor domain-containing protein [Bacteroidales bacterium]